MDNVGISKEEDFIQNMAKMSVEIDQGSKRHVRSFKYIPSKNSQRGIIQSSENPCLSYRSWKVTLNYDPRDMREALNEFLQQL
jgi:hypothetical protein